MPLPEWIENRLKATQDNAFMWDALYALAAWAEDEIANEKAPHHQHHCHYCAVGFAAQHLRFTLAEFAAWKDENVEHDEVGPDLATPEQHLADLEALAEMQEEDRWNNL